MPRARPPADLLLIEGHRRLLVGRQLADDLPRDGLALGQVVGLEGGLLATNLGGKQEGGGARRAKSKTG